MSTPGVMATSRALVEAIGAASRAWATVLLDTDNVTAWNAHTRAQARVTWCRAEHTQARVAARLAKSRVSR